MGMGRFEKNKSKYLGIGRIIIFKSEYMGIGRMVIFKIDFCFRCRFIKRAWDVRVLDSAGTLISPRHIELPRV